MCAQSWLLSSFVRVNVFFRVVAWQLPDAAALFCSLRRYLFCSCVRAREFEALFYYESYGVQTPGHQTRASSIILKLFIICIYEKRAWQPQFEAWNLI